jgi:hypothetical protein
MLIMKELSVPESLLKTGGSGNQGFNTMVNAPAGADALFSQGSLAIHDFIIGNS